MEVNYHLVFLMILFSYYSPAGSWGTEHSRHYQREEEQGPRVLPLLAEEQDTQVRNYMFPFECPTSQFHRRTENAIERRAGWINVGDLSSAVHFKIVKYERIKFLVIGETIFNLLPTPAYNILHFFCSSEGLHWDLRLGSEALPQVHGI